MKRMYYLPLLMLFFTCIPMISHAQVSNNNEYGVYKPVKDAKRYVEGEVIVKFTDVERVSIKRSAKAQFLSASAVKVDALLKDMGTFQMEQLMPLTGAKMTQGARKALSSNRMVHDVDLSQLYRVKFDKDKMTVEQAVEKLKTLDNVAYAEPNYIVYICAEESDGKTYSDPLFSEQWGIPAINLPKLWSAPRITDKRPVIAILDTGVDIAHPDLADNIWTNLLESNGEEDVDDDGNGFNDDVHGWDFTMNVPISATNTFGRDRNGHGTHCAGIAAAVGNNGIGVVGANPDALIMPVKVLVDDGAGDLVTIYAGIDYAIANGADILSMSFGSIGEFSSSCPEVLTKAFMKGIIPVAAAGNYGMDIYSYGSLYSGLMEPAMFDIVLGVMATDQTGKLAGFSNYDPDGPFYSSYETELSAGFFNYDVKAPGVDILSTFPGGKYKSLSGTSMACPLVAGTVSRLIQSKEFDYAMMGDISATSLVENAPIDIYSVLESDGKNASLHFVKIEMDDSEGDGDGNIDAGEIINFYPTLRVIQGLASNIKISASTTSSNVELLTDEVDFGYTLSPFATMKCTTPIRVKVKDGVEDGTHFTMNFKVTSPDATANDKTLGYDILNVQELGGVITSDIVLETGRYRTTKPLGIQTGASLTISPNSIIEIDHALITNNGTITVGNNCEITFASLYESIENNGSLIVKDGCEIKGSLNCYNHGEIRTEGKRDSRIKFWGSVNISNTYDSKIEASYADFIDGLNFNSDIDNNVSLNFCNIKYLYYQYRGADATCINNCNIGSGRTQFINSDWSHFENSNIYIQTLWLYYTNPSTNYFPTEYNYVLNNLEANPADYPIQSVYVGTNSEAIIRSSLHDFTTGEGWLTADLTPLVNATPSSTAPGILCKLYIDGFEAQDDFYKMPPIGVGRHKFELVYNKPVDKQYAPIVSMGVYEPYDQILINEDGSWNEAGDRYTVYVTLQGKTNSDGLNHIVVSGGKDLDGLDILAESYDVIGHWAENGKYVTETFSRFNAIVQVAGSMATGLMADAGVGKVKLTWETAPEDFADLMGYNVYRYNEREERYTKFEYGDHGWDYYEHVDIVLDTIMVNKSLLDATETELIDYDVVPGTTYYYYIKEMGTDLQQHDVSNVVAATPLTATKGDANGSMTVDVADVVTEINYLTNQNPQPFIFEAADVNEDKTVNILDVVGTVNIIMTPAGASTASVDNTATFTVEDGILYVDATTPLGGVQVSVQAEQGTEIQVLEGLNGMEYAGTWMSDNEYMLLAYSMSGRTIGIGKQPLLRIGDTEVKGLVASDAQGHNVLAINGTATSIDELPFGMEDFEGAEVRYYDLSGRQISASAARAKGLCIQSLYLDGKLMKSYKMIK